MPKLLLFIVIFSFIFTTVAAAEDDWDTILDKLEILLDRYIENMEAYYTDPQGTGTLEMYLDVKSEYEIFMQNLYTSAHKMNEHQLLRYKILMKKYYDAIRKIIG